VDSGLAVGPLIGGFVVARVGLPALYQALAVMLGVTLAIHLASRRPRAVRA
jgi:predicted MFS family arabinose efflux permease